MIDNHRGIVLREADVATYVLGKPINYDKAAETARNIIAHERLFRLGIASNLLVFAGDVVLIVSLYVILERANRNLAKLAAFFRIVESDAALFELARRYFTTRGPATINDFSWWSGLTKADAKRGVEAAATHLEHESIKGRSYWFPAADRSVRFSSPLAHLLPNYDEYFIGFKDRSAFSMRLKVSGVEARTGALSGHILSVNGQIVGGWRRTIVGQTVVIEPTLLIRLSEAELRADGVTAGRVGRFLALSVEIQWRRTQQPPPKAR